MSTPWRTPVEQWSKPTKKWHGPWNTGWLVGLWHGPYNSKHSPMPIFHWPTFHPLTQPVTPWSLRYLVSFWCVLKAAFRDHHDPCPLVGSCLNDTVDGRFFFGFWHGFHLTTQSPQSRKDDPKCAIFLNIPYCWCFRNPQTTTVWMYSKPIVNNGISTTNFNWWSPDFWTINSITHPIDSCYRFLLPFALARWTRNKSEERLVNGQPFGGLPLWDNRFQTNFGGKDGLAKGSTITCWFHVSNCSLNWSP